MVVSQDVRSQDVVFVFAEGARRSTRRILQTNGLGAFRARGCESECAARITSSCTSSRCTGREQNFLWCLVLGNEEVDVFDIDNMVDEVMSEFEADQKAVAKEMVATGAKKATTAEKVCKQSSASVANGARGFKASKKNSKRCLAAKSSRMVLKRPSGIFVAPFASSQKEKENISPQIIHI